MYVDIMVAGWLEINNRMPATGSALEEFGRSWCKGHREGQ